MANQIIAGPILNFRGARDGKWQTSALVVTEGDGTPPQLRFGQPETAVDPVGLKTLGARRVWRFDWFVTQDPNHEQTVDYSINGGGMFRYVVPKTDQPLRIAYGSCFGFSSLKYMNKVQDKNAMWTVLRDKQEGRTGEKPYHLMMMGGDQVYADAMWETVPSMKAWADRSKKQRFHEPFTPEMDREVEAFYFDLYCQRWTQEVPAAVLGQIPSIMMWDDHDIFDGWGSYPEDQHKCPVYQGIYQRAREHFRLFQLQAGSDGDRGAGALMNGSGFSYGYRFGKIGILALDMRSERTQFQVMSPETWNSAYAWLSSQFPKRSPNSAPTGEHLIVMSSIPVVYVNSNMLEAAFGWIPGQQDLEDDLKDQWVSRTHMEERLRLIHRLLLFSKETGCRVTIVSGDVHVAALGYIESERDPEFDEANVVNQLISSAMNHPPPSSVIIYLMEKVMGDKVEEIDRGITARMLKFPGNSSRFIGKRNWLSLTFDDQSRIWGEWYVEGENTPYTKVIHPVGALSS